MTDGEKIIDELVASVDNIYELLTFFSMDKEGFRRVVEDYYYSFSKDTPDIESAKETAQNLENFLLEAKRAFEHK